MITERDIEVAEYLHWLEECAFLSPEEWESILIFKG